MYRYFEEKGMSPAIGVVLLVAVTVALVSLFTVIIFNIGEDVSNTGSATVQTTTGINGFQTQVLRNENVEMFEIIGPNGKKELLNGDVGSISNMNDGNGVYIVKAILSDNSEEVINSVTVNSIVELIESSGTVSINPNIEGAIVQSVDNGFIIDETVTDENGEYNLDSSEHANIRVIVDGFEHEELDNKLYASAERFDTTENGNFTFIMPENTNNVNGVEILTSSSIEEETNVVQTIGTLEQLQSIKDDLESDYKLVSDIDASKTQTWNNNDGFEPIGDFDSYFTGGFDGQDYIISDLYINRTSQWGVGLFGAIQESTITNINIEDADFNSSGGTGIIVGWVDVNSQISNTTVSGTINGNTEVGGIVGWIIDGSTVFNSQSMATVQGEEYIGGVVGVADSLSTIDSSSSSGDVTGIFYVGGLTGSANNDALILNSRSFSKINGEASVGGLVGLNSGEIQSSYVTNNEVYGDRYTGGLVGFNGFDGIINNSYSDNIIYGSEQSIGGLIGENENDGGFVSDSHATGNVIASQAVKVGGLIGNERYGNISKSYATGNVIGKTDVGGFMGYNVGDESNSITGSYSVGDVEGELNVGGFVGSNHRFSNSPMMDIYSIGDVSGDKNIGGLIGFHRVGFVDRAYITSDVTGSENSGSIIGKGGRDAEYNADSGECRGGEGSITDIYYNTDKTSKDTISASGDMEEDCEGVEIEENNVQALTTIDMNGESAEDNMSEFDFITTWDTVLDNYPELQWQN